MASTELVIAGSGISIEYKIYRHRVSGIKDFVVQRLRGKRDYRLFRALEDITVEIARGESVALIGHNGCGKSTLLKVIAGILPPSTGTVHTVGRIAPMIELGAGFDFELSGMENIELSCMLLGLSKAEIAYRRPQIVEFAELGDFIYSPLKNYSSGMAARIGFACATAVEPAILLIDEVLSVGDANFSRKCLKRIHELRGGGTTVVMVSHDANVVREFCDRAYVFEHGRMQFAGPVHQSLSEHMRIMDRRAYDSLPQAVREDTERKRSLQRSLSMAGRPAVEVAARIVQNDVPTDQVDLTQPFQLKFVVDLTGGAGLRPGVAFGIGLEVNGVRITGFNNLDLGYDDPFAAMAGVSRLEVEYQLDHGLPSCVEGSYNVIFALHDDQISREIFVGTVLTFNGSNSVLGLNRHGYLTDVSKQVTRFALLPLSGVDARSEC